MTPSFAVVTSCFPEPWGTGSGEWIPDILDVGGSPATDLAEEDRLLSPLSQTLTRHLPVCGLADTELIVLKFLQ